MLVAIQILSVILDHYNTAIYH